MVSVVITLFVAFAFCAGQNEKKTSEQSCLHTAKTQGELNECAGVEEQKADAELNHVYSALLQKLTKDPVALESLKASELQWLKYRDAQMKALHPHPEGEGSVRPMCVSLEKAELTTQRIKALRNMLNPVEGEVCAY